MTMEESFQKLLEENPGIALIPKEDVSKIKIKMGKSHRKESDWDVIKEILYNHDLITVAPQNATHYVNGVSGVLCEEGVLIAFTNFDDCERHLKELYKRDNRIADMRFLPVGEIVKKLNQILIGYDHYYGITDNSPWVRLLTLLL